MSDEISKKQFLSESFRVIGIASRLLFLLCERICLLVMLVEMSCRFLHRGNTTHNGSYLWIRAVYEIFLLVV